MSAEVNEAIANALNAEIKEQYGDDVFQAATLVISLVEFPKQENAKPDENRLRLKVKTLQPIPIETAGKMLEQAALVLKQNAMKENPQT